MEDDIIIETKIYYKLQQHHSSLKKLSHLRLSCIKTLEEIMAYMNIYNKNFLIIL